jgi:ribosomal protein S18 acetylase RimI-like enzyme
MLPGMASLPDAAATIRPMSAADLPAAFAVSAAAFDVDVNAPGMPGTWQQRLAHPLETDPGGSFVAERDGRIIGIAQAILRERLWNLSMLAVDPSAQSANTGRALFDRALQYGDEAEFGLIVSSSDPRALRLYATAGFSLRPALNASGKVDPNGLPPPTAKITEAGHPDLEALGEISRAVRGGPHTPELEWVLRQGWPLLRLGDRGFTVVAPQWGRIWLLVALDDGAAADLMSGALRILADCDEVGVRWITGAQDWAVDVALRAGLALTVGGALGVRGAPGRLRAYIPSGPFA